MRERAATVRANELPSETAERFESMRERAVTVRANELPYKTAERLESMRERAATVSYLLTQQKGLKV